MDVIGFRMKDLRDAYQVTDSLGKPVPRSRPLGLTWHTWTGPSSLRFWPGVPELPGPPGRVLG